MHELAGNGRDDDAMRMDEVVSLLRGRNRPMQLVGLRKRGYDSSHTTIVDMLRGMEFLAHNLIMTHPFVRRISRRAAYSFVM